MVLFEPIKKINPFISVCNQEQCKLLETSRKKEEIL